MVEGPPRDRSCGRDGHRSDGGRSDGRRRRSDGRFARDRGGVPDILLQLHDSVACLAEALVQLTVGLLKSLRLLGGTVEVLVDLVDVVALEPEAELNRAERVENG